MEAERTASQPESQSPSRQGSSTSQELIRRAPSGFLWYQAFIFWLFISNWLVTLVVRRTLSLDEAGVYGLVIGAANLAVYLASLGLGNAAAVFLPRALAEGGPGRAMAVALRLIVVRLASVLVLAAAVLWGLPLLANFLAITNLPGTASLAQTLSDPRLTSHRLVLVAYLIGYGMTNLLAALLTALLRTKTVFLVNSLVQLAQIGLMYFVIVRLRAGADGAILAQALPVGLASLVYGFWLHRLLADHARPARAPAMGPILRLGIATALSDLANNSLVSLLAQIQLLLGLAATLVAAGMTQNQASQEALQQVALFGAAFTLGHSAALIGVEGLGGVSIAIMSAAYVDHNRPALATAWRTVVKLHVLLAVPLVVFCVPHASAIIQIVYTQRYASAGPYLALFLAMNALVQLAGGGSHEPALYVLGRQRWAVISRWGALGVMALGDALLIPRFGPMGALFAVGLGQILAEVFQLVLVRGAVARRYPLGFIVRLLAAMIIPVGVTVLWRPASLPGLAVAGVVYVVLFVACLWLIKPLDAEDGGLLQQLARPLRVALRPFVSAARRGAAPAASHALPLVAPIEAGTAPLPRDPSSSVSRPER